MSPRFKRPVAAGLALVAGMALLAGCAGNRNSSGIFSPYRVAIPQGNYINQQMLDEVREGMSPEDVRLRIGTPLLADVFHPNRWDYVFRFQYPNGESELRRVRVFFRNDQVSAITHDKLPARDDPNDPALPGYNPDDIEDDRESQS